MLKHFLMLLAFMCLPICLIAQEDSSWTAWEENKVGNTLWLMHHLEKGDVELLKSKWDEIGRSLGSQPSEYAGTYLVPDYMSGYFLRLSEYSGYVFVRFFDVQHPCYFSFGEVNIKDASVEFVHKGESTRSACPSSNDGPPAAEWVAALGGEYLVPRGEIVKFAAYYGGFDEFNGYLRRFDSSIPFCFSMEPKNSYRFKIHTSRRVCETDQETVDRANHRGRENTDPQIKDFYFRKQS